MNNNKQRLEKYSERFDNKNNELAEGIFNPDTWGKRVVEEHVDILDMCQISSKEEPKQETLEEAAEIYAEENAIDSNISYHNLYAPLEYAFRNGAKWQQEQILDFLYEEITERRDYSASKMCEKVIEFIEQFKNK